MSNSKKVTIIGPAIVGWVKPGAGCFKIGNTGGMMDNILHSNLYRPGSVAYLSRSGGMSNELNIIISQTTVCTRAWPSWATLTCSPPTRSSGMPEPEPALGPPRRPPRPRMLLWAARRPWCRHPLTSSGTRSAKSRPAPSEVPPPPVPMDYNWARELGLIRKPASFITSISDELGQELLYAGIPISEVFRQDMGIGGVLSLLWFQRRLPPYVCKFLEMCLMIMAAQPSGHYALPGGKSMDRSNN